MIGLCFPSSQETSQGQTSPTTVPETAIGHQDGRHHMMFDGLIEFFFCKNDTTWSAKQVCPRPVKAGLGGHDAGVLGVDEGVEKASLPLRKWGRMALFVCATFSGFKGV